jgi:hypothetical protein
MSYCVNCGVELEPSEKLCPLCGVEVHNPRQPFPEDAWRPYPRREDPAIAQINRRFIASFISIAIALTMIICLLVERFYHDQLNWSLYVAGALAMIWVWIVPGLIYRNPGYFKVSLPIIISLLGFLLMIEQLQAVKGWFVPLALPLVLLVASLTSLLVILGERQVIRGFVWPSAIFAALGLLIIGIEMVINHYLMHIWHLSWSWFAFLPCLAMSLGSLVVARRQKVRSEIIKRLHL